MKEAAETMIPKIIWGGWEVRNVLPVMGLLG
jgi:hypothetical protein